jgi:hypothetical protein
MHHLYLFCVVQANRFASRSELSICVPLFGFTADHPKSDEYLSDSRLAAYAVPYRQVIAGYACVIPLKIFL